AKRKSEEKWKKTMRLGAFPKKILAYIIWKLKEVPDIPNRNNKCSSWL
ncbi:MAG: hypothetical protein ACI805_001715, partial [Candidatus Azotimanducaceae bacterium]